MNNKLQNQSCFVFGTGSVARSANRVISSLGFSIDSYFDNNRDKWHGTFNGRPILPPETITRKSPRPVIIASSFYNEIQKQLLRLGTLQQNILVYPGYGLPNGLINAFTYTDLPHTWDTLVLPITERCNLRCAHCKRSSSGYNPTWTATPELFRAFLSRFKPENFRECCVSGSGEATVVTDLSRYLRDAKAMGWNNLSIITNGTCQDQHLLEMLIVERLLNTITISIEAANEKLFQSIRGFPFSRFLRFLELLRDIRQKAASSMETIFNATFGAMNLNQLSDFIELAQRYNINFVRFHPLIAYFSPGDARKYKKMCSTDHTIDDPFRADVLESFSLMRQKARNAGIVVSDVCGILDYLDGRCTSPPLTSMRYCWEPYRIVRVEPDGSIYPCCPMDNRHPIGNITDTPFDEIWRGPGYRKLLSVIDKGGQHHYPGCFNCPRANGNATEQIHPVA